MTARTATLAVGTLLALALAGCQGNGALLPWTQVFGGSDFQSYLRLDAYAARLDVTTPAPGRASFALRDVEPDGYRATWEASRGTLSATAGRTTVWTAPGPSEPRPLIAYVRCRVSAPEAGTERTFRVRVDAADQVKVEPLDELGYIDDISM